ncbi:MAG TPA: LacI family DNA-binding transcriptional regulator [Acidimicrobiales bacterium]|nr:LacI family DNA-binding transcriptional regulator [Acidimicrobiales bacterium]
MTIRDVARLAGVSLGTVSNVLNNPGVVADETRARVIGIIEETGFVRSTAAHQLRVGKSRTVGVVLLDIANPFFAEMVQGAERVLRDNGYVLMVCSSDESAERERRYLRVLEEHRVDGLLIAPVERDLKAVAAMAARGVPTVLLDRDAGTANLCSVTVDDVRGGELAAKHLIELGHRPVGFVNGPLSIRQCTDRRLGALRALRRARRPASDLVEISVSALTVGHGEEAVTSLLSALPRPTAVMCANDLLALGVLRGLAGAGVAVPRDMAVVGYDDVTFASMLSPPLTSVRQPKFQLGVSAAELLLEETTANGGHVHRSVRFEPELVVRASSAPLR